MGAFVTAGEIRRGIESLKGMCDPRGHDLLDAIGEVLTAQVGAVDMVDAAFQLQGARDWVDGLAPPPYVTTQVRMPTAPELTEPDVHSRRVPPTLRSVS